MFYSVDLSLTGKFELEIGQNASLLEIRTDWSPSKFKFGKFGASNFSERLVPSIRRDGGTPGPDSINLGKMEDTLHKTHDQFWMPMGIK